MSSSRRGSGRRSFRWQASVLLGAVAGLPISSAVADTSLLISPIQWTDRLGNTHEAKNTNLDFYDYNSVFGETGLDTFLGNAATDLSGAVNFTTNRDDFGNFIEFYTYVRAAIPNIAHVKAILADPEPYRQIYPNPATLTLDVQENDVGIAAGTTVDNTNVNNIGTAIGFVQALGFMGNYYNTTHSAALPFVTVEYRSAITDSAYYGGANPRIELRYGAWGAWDVLMHEYGHHIATVKGFDTSLGGGHSHGTNNIGVLQQGVAALPGAELAWSEGIATHLGQMAVKDGNLAGYFAAALPAQDTDTNYDSYQSLSSVTNETHLVFRYSVETKTSSIVGRTPRGEGDEWAIGLAMWDFYDTGAANNENYAAGINRKDRASFGAQKIFQLLDNSNANTFRAAWHAIDAAAIADPTLVGLAADAPEHQVLATLGEILQENTIASRPNTSGNVGIRPKLNFTEGNDDRSGSYAVVVFDDEWDLVTSFMAPNDLNSLGSFDWDVDVDLTIGDQYWWAVLNTSALYNLTQPALATDIDKWYWSGANLLNIVPEPMMLGVVSLIGLLGSSRRRLRS